MTRIFTNYAELYSAVNEILEYRDDIPYHVTTWINYGMSSIFLEKFISVLRRPGGLPFDKESFILGGGRFHVIHGIKLPECDVNVSQYTFQLHINDLPEYLTINVCEGDAVFVDQTNVPLL